MATIDTTLDFFKIPGIDTFAHEFGTKKPNGKGLTTEEVANNIAASFNRQRPFVITETSNTNRIDANSVFAITASDEIILSLDSAAFTGLEVKIINSTDKTHIIRCASASEADSTLQAKQIQTIIWNGSKWEGLSCPRIGEIYVQYPQQEAPQDLFICTKWALQEQYAGAFFRATGGNAAAFIEKTGELIAQKAQAPNSTGTGIITITSSSKYSIKGEIYINGSQEDFRLGSDSYGTNRIAIDNSREGASVDINGNNIYTSNGELRPKNFSVKLWLRTA